MRRGTGPVTPADVATVEAFGAALEQAAAGIAALTAGWQRAGVVVSQSMRQMAKGALIEAAFAQTPRHRDTPHPDDVRQWLSMNAGSELAARLSRAYADQLGTRVPELYMRRTRDNGVRALPVGWTLRITQLRRARRAGGRVDG